MKTVYINEENKKDLLKTLLKRSTGSYPEYEKSVADILENVKENGDKAVFEYTLEFDGFNLNASNIKVTREEIDKAYSLLDSKYVEVIKEAAENIKSFHEKQLLNTWIDTKPDGSILG